MKVRYTPQALADLGAIYDYLERHSPPAAARIKAAIRLLISGLADFPEAGPVTDMAGVRVLLAGRLPYLIFYRIRADEVHIVHVRHASRQSWRSNS